jgi:hypothetical protein
MQIKSLLTENALGPIPHFSQNRAPPAQMGCVKQSEHHLYQEARHIAADLEASTSPPKDRYVPRPTTTSLSRFSASPLTVVSLATPNRLMYSSALMLWRCLITPPKGHDLPGEFAHDRCADNGAGTD